MKQEESDGEKRLGVRDRRRVRKERRSTGIVQPGGEVRHNPITSQTWPSAHQHSGRRLVTKV